MRRLTYLIVLILFSASFIDMNAKAFAEDLSIKVLEVPIQNVDTSSLPKGSNGKVDLSFYEPYSVEFNGSEAQKYSSCEQLVEGISGLVTTWTAAGIVNESAISRSNVLYTIGLTKSGIQCALSRRVRTWWGTDYRFSPGEKSIPMTISIYVSGVKFAEKTGTLKNPSYSPPSPLIVGVTRGDTAHGFLKFKLEGNLPERNSDTLISLGLCPPDTNLGQECGWGFLDADGNAVVVANPDSYGKSTTLIVRWDLTNETGNAITIESKLVGVNVLANSTPIPWEIMRNLNLLKIALDLDCENSALKSGAEVGCEVNPELVYSRSGYGTTQAKLNAEIAFQALIKSDNCVEQSLTTTLFSNRKNIYKLKIPKGTTSIVQLKFIPASPTWQFSTENLYPGVKAGVVTLGQNPTSFGYSAGNGSNCHVYTDRAARPIAKVPTGKIDKSSFAYKKMVAVGKNFKKISLPSETGKTQCTSALQSGIIRANGIPKYLGVQATFIQSYLATASGFQGCIDGFGR